MKTLHAEEQVKDYSHSAVDLYQALKMFCTYVSCEICNFVITVFTKENLCWWTIQWFQRLHCLPVLLAGIKEVHRVTCTTIQYWYKKRYSTCWSSWYWCRSPFPVFFVPTFGVTLSEWTPLFSLDTSNPGVKLPNLQEIQVWGGLSAYFGSMQLYPENLAFTWLSVDLFPHFQ